MRYRALGDQRGEAAMYVVQGSTAYYMGDYQTARARYAESLVLFRQTGDEPSMSVALNNLANIAKQEGRTDKSVTLYEESLAIKRRLGDARGIAIALNNLGTVAVTQGAFSGQPSSAKKRSPCCATSATRTSQPPSTRLRAQPSIAATRGAPPICIARVWPCPVRRAIVNWWRFVWKAWVGWLPRVAMTVAQRPSTPPAMRCGAWSVPRFRPPNTQSRRR